MHPLPGAGLIDDSGSATSRLPVAIRRGLHLSPTFISPGRLGCQPEYHRYHVALVSVVVLCQLEYSPRPPRVRPRGQERERKKWSIWYYVVQFSSVHFRSLTWQPRLHCGLTGDSAGRISPGLRQGAPAARAPLADARQQKKKRAQKKVNLGCWSPSREN